ncbi:MAG: glycosyltransferase, partial [bacterium]|nr:glycosyltransferase [bacterium]
MTRITMVIYSLDGGGAERVLVNLASGFLQRGHSVSVITLKRTADFYTLPEGTHRIALDVAGTSRNKVDAVYHNLRRITLVRRATLSTRPDVVIAFSDSTNVVTVLALTGTRIPVIITEHVDPAMLPPPNAIWRRLVRRIYPRAAKLVTVSKGVESRFEWLPAHKRQTIHNPLLLNGLNASAARPCPPGEKCVMAMGRLVPVKGF